MFTKLNFVESNVSIKEKSYYQMGGIAQYFATPNSLSEIIQVIQLAKEHSLPIAILGSGSNCIFSDEYFDGLVISLTNLKKWWWESDSLLFVESGLTNTEVANICLDAERAGASWMYRMPGQIGASVRMNARCYGGEMSQIVTEILTIDTNGHLKAIPAKEIFKGYKSTCLMNTPEIVVGVRMHFSQTKNADILRAHMQSCEDNRNSKMHFLHPSCGSTFKNNYSYGKPSGQIFDELGLKGKKRGSAEVSAYHGNFIWNKGFAHTADMLELSAYMRKLAQEKRDVELNLEVQPIGKFTKEQFINCGMRNLGPYINTENHYVTGLFNPSNILVHTVFPQCLFSSFFSEYFQTKQSTVPNVRVQLTQLMSVEEAANKPTLPFLSWTTECPENYTEIFKLVPSKEHKVEKLWEYSVSELFLSHPQKNEYLECEMAPNGECLVLEFKNKRIQKKSRLFTKPINLNYLQKNTIDTYIFGMEFSFDQIKNYIHSGMITIQCALSLGNQEYWLAPYWSEKNHEKSADFHQPEKFLPIQLF